MIAYQVERLNADYRQVENALHLRRQFVANASHELKSPLTSIQGFAEMLYEGMEDGEEERETFLKCILNECARMRALIDDILMLSRAELQTDQPLQNVDVAQTAGEIRSALFARAQQTGISVEISGQLTLNVVEKDIWELLYNLMDNAVRYNKPNGSVCVRLSRDRIEVEDSGIGIPAEHQPLLFEQFYRVEPENGNSTGTGLGLAIAQRIAEKYGARIEVSSQVGKGSLFAVCFSNVRTV